MQDAYELYRTRERTPDSPAALDFRRLYARPGAWPQPIVHFLGVWDTVGALGIPLASMKLLAKFTEQRYAFHDTQLSAVVATACHAIAVDEHRPDYQPTLWEPTTEPHQSMEQRWFLGPHSDVGGGSDQEQLSVYSLVWMVQQAQ